MANNFYRPDLCQPIPIYLLRMCRAQMTKNLGMVQREFPTVTEAMQDKANRLLCTFKTYQGTERVVDGATVYEDTATVSTQYNPNIKIGDRVYNPANGKTYEIITQPEDINQKHRFVVFKVRAVVPYGKTGL